MNVSLPLSRARHSSANNHLIGELIGLVVAEATWPVWSEVARWGKVVRDAGIKGD